ncbi:isoprenylcysteine carboxylmethyltransferase family protein [Phanerochaete sordida]|uniref:Protein-S-isoprenylcysteine O-methyltransferase n=1 Tax=Phanerochaete sordida TaxID=48140 RepID=A0A9P3LBV4_9APHY|nr:isoprenylcysteine carboxylmethyltransferase family protein [Phanerochaete sordida]
MFSAVTFFCGMKPPTPPAEHQNVVYKGQFFERAVRKITYLWQAVFCSAVLGHVIVLLTLPFPTARSMGLVWAVCHNPSPSLVAMAQLSPLFLASVVLLVTGGALRMWCYSTLGRHFTFEVTILRGHTLVTSGPYAWARHPSYTGGCMMILATTCIFYGSDGYVAGCSMQHTPFAVFVHLWKLLAPYAAFSLIKRADVEDSQLKKTFGQTWEAYREKVPSKFIPYFV